MLYRFGAKIRPENGLVFETGDSSIKAGISIKIGQPKSSRDFGTNRIRHPRQSGFFSAVGVSL